MYTERSYKWPFSISFFSLSAIVIEMIFAQICASKWTKVKRCFGRVFYHFIIFGLKNAKKSPF